MTTLHLGVIDTPYSAGDKTTGDVAEILEDKYHIYELFYEEYQGDIAGVLEETIGDQLESLMSGASPRSNSMAATTDAIETMFRRFISTQEVEGLGIPGVPTQAALDGVNHRLAHPYAKSNPRRPSFRDTGLFVGSGKAWID